MKLTEAKIRAINTRWTGENYPPDTQVDSSFARNDILDLLDEVAAQRIENERLRVELELQRPEFEEALTMAKKDEAIAIAGFNTASILNNMLGKDLETAVSHLRAILDQHGDASESLVQAERWLMSREVMK